MCLGGADEGSLDNKEASEVRRPLEGPYECRKLHLVENEYDFPQRYRVIKFVL